ncbi:MAG: PEP-CTERM sorting domain-containing protein, partial [Roseiarcus sp.]
GGGGAGYDGGGGGGGSYINPSFSNLVSNPGANGSSDYATPSKGVVTVGGTSFDYTGAIVDYTILTSGLYDIVAAGAQGGAAFGDPGGYGAEVGGDIGLSAGLVLGILVGGAGGQIGGDGIIGGGGGGGSFVWIVSEQSVVPESSTWAMMLLGFTGLGWTAHRRSKQAVEI